MPRQFLPRPPQPLVRGSGLAHGRAGHAAVNTLSRAVSGGVAVAAASSSASHRDRRSALFPNTRAGMFPV